MRLFIKLLDFVLPLTQKIQLGKHLYSERRGILVRPKYPSERNIFGEASPLPHFSSETLDEAKGQLLELCTVADGIEIPDATLPLHEWRGTLDIPDLFPSVRFALESIALQMAMAEHKNESGAWRQARAAVPCNGLVTADIDFEDEIERLIDEGFTSIKIKFGHSGPGAAARMLNEAYHLGKGRVKFRVDGNRFWPLKYALDFGRDTVFMPLEFVEEPIREGLPHPELKQFPHPIAADESLVGMQPEDVVNLDGVDVVILKPTILGGLAESARFAHVAQENGKRVVVTSSIESSIGLSSLVPFAALYGTPDLAMGLETSSLFAMDTVDVPIAPKSGVIESFEIQPAVDNTGFRQFQMRRQSKECPLQDVAKRDLSAISSAGADISYGKLDEMVESIRPQARFKGVRFEHGIAVVPESSANWIAMLWGLLRCGATVCLMPTRWPANLSRDSLKDLGISATALHTGQAFPEWTDAETVLRLSAVASPITDRMEFVAAEEPAAVVFTSGSTAQPKAALLSFGNLYYNALGSNENIRLSPGCRWLLSLPLYHVGGLSILFRCFISGATVVIPDENKPLLQNLLEQKITHLSLVSTQLRWLLDDGLSHQMAPHLKYILLGGGPTPEPLIEEAHRRGLPIYRSYGLTEMGSQVVTSSKPDGSARIVLPHRELKITDDGEVLVRGETLFQGYLTEHGLDPARDENGWFATGDLAEWPDGGEFRLLGRKDNMFISGGENVQPELIERELAGLPGVRLAVVVAVPDDTFGHVPVAFIDPVPSDAHTVRELLSERLPRFMVPKLFFEWPHAELGHDLKPSREKLRCLAIARVRELDSI